MIREYDRNDSGKIEYNDFVDISNNNNNMKINKIISILDSPFVLCLLS